MIDDWPPNSVMSGSASSRQISLSLILWEASVSPTGRITPPHITFLFLSWKRPSSLPHPSRCHTHIWFLSSFLPHVCCLLIPLFSFTPYASLHFSLSPAIHLFLLHSLSPSLSVSSPLLPPHHFFFASIHCPLCASLYTAAAPSWHTSLCRINGAIICLYHSVLSLTFTQTHTVRPSVTAGPSTELDNWLVYLKYFPLNWF